jgi:hypothetical protein
MGASQRDGQNAWFARGPSTEFGQEGEDLF